MRARLRPVPVLAAAALVAASAGAWALVAAPPAWAHNYVVSSTPEEGGVLDALPERFDITTNESLLDIDGSGSGFAMQVTDADGAFYGDACPEVSGVGMSIPAPQLGEPGEYELTYQFISADGHTLSDVLPFEWAPTGDVEPAEGSSTAPSCGGGEASAQQDGAESAESEDGSAASADLVWILGAAGAVVAAVVVTLLVLRRRLADGAPEQDAPDRDAPDRAGG